MPATGALRGTPASIIDRELPQTVAIDDDPLDSVISDTTLMVYGKSSFDGKRGFIALQASFPCPISRRPGPNILPASPTEYGGKL